METSKNNGLALLLQGQARMLKKLQETVKTLKQDVETLNTVAGMYLKESQDWERETDYIKILTEPRDSWGKA